MKKVTIITVILLALIIACTPCLAADQINWAGKITLPSQYQQQSYHPSEVAPYIALYPDFGNGARFSEFAVDFRCEHLPYGTYIAIGNFDLGSYQLSRNYKSITRDYGSVGGYCGFQVWGDGSRKAILTIWDTYCTDYNGRKTTISARQIFPENGQYGEYVKGDLLTGEGSFYHIIVPFDWQEDHDYRALIQIENYSNENSRLCFYVYDLQKQFWTLLAGFDLGYREAYMKTMCSFLENYIPYYGGELRSMVMKNYRVLPYGTGTWKSATRGYFCLGYSHPGSYNFGVSGDTFWAITSALPNLCKNPQNGNYKVSGADSSWPY